MIVYDCADVVLRPIMLQIKYILNRAHEGPVNVCVTS